MTGAPLGLLALLVKWRRLVSSVGEDYVEDICGG